MVDLAATLEQFQDALFKGLIAPTHCVLRPNLSMLHDDADGVSRLTYAQIVDGEVQALVAFITVECYNGLPCLNVGLAVAPAHRRKGLGTRILNDALCELESFLAQGGVEKYYIEGVASIHNDPSNAICRRVFTDSPTRIVCQHSAEDAFQYVKLYPNDKA